MNQCDAFSLAATQEADYGCVHERDVIQVQDRAFTLVIHLCF
jgi:hypothetical protein